MSVHATRVTDSARLENLGSDIRTIAGGATQAVCLREKLAEHIVALIKQGKNVLLKGASGTGKTALVHSLPHAKWPTNQTGQLRLVDSRPFSAPKIVETHPARFIEGCQWAHDLENKVAEQLGAARAASVIVFIDNVDVAIGMGASRTDPTPALGRRLRSDAHQAINCHTPGEGRRVGVGDVGPSLFGPRRSASLHAGFDMSIWHVKPPW